MFAALSKIIILWQLITVFAKKESSPCIDVSNHPKAHLLSSSSPCGQSNQIADRVMGGTNAALAEFPWMARLFTKSKDELRDQCGGSIINDRYIVTAAHCCVGEMDSELAFVRLGEYDTATHEDCYRGHCAPPYIDIGVDRIISHPDYNPKEITNDICLLRLREKILFTEYKSPICLPTECELQRSHFNDATMTVAGWGYLDEETDRPVEILQKLQVGVVPWKICKRKWKKDDQATIHPTNICAGKSVGEDVCNGDSGGPLMYSSPDNKYYLAGLVSFGNVCSQKDKEIMPGVYTKVSSYLDWILDNIEE